MPVVVEFARNVGQRVVEWGGVVCGRGNQQGRHREGRRFCEWPWVVGGGNDGADGADGMDLVEEGELDTGDCFHRGNVCWFVCFAVPCRWVEPALDSECFGGPEGAIFWTF